MGHKTKGMVLRRIHDRGDGQTELKAEKLEKDL